MFGQFKEVMKVMASIRGLWNGMQKVVFDGGGIKDLFSFVESNAHPDHVKAAQNTPVWNNIKHSDSPEQARNTIYSFAQEKIPFFKDKSMQEAEEYITKMGKNTGFLE